MHKPKNSFEAFYYLQKLEHIAIVQKQHTFAMEFKTKQSKIITETHMKAQFLNGICGNIQLGLCIITHWISLTNRYIKFPSIFSGLRLQIIDTTNSYGATT